MDIEKTAEYYRSLTADDICQCAYCKNYVSQIRRVYPETAAFLESIGVDIEKPFELFPLHPGHDEQITYLDVQYAVIGSREGFKRTQVGGVTFDIAGSHPVTGIGSEHFVIEADCITLKWPKKIRQ